MKLHPRLTAEGVLLARGAECFRPIAERDERGWVVGYGHRASAREGARVGEDDALALLAYDLSQTARRVEPLLRTPVAPPLFDAFNAYAFRFGPEAFGRSEMLLRANAGEPVSPAEAAAEGEASDRAPTSAVAVAAQAVRERLSQVLVEPPPPPPRAPREPWREPAPAGSDDAVAKSKPEPEPEPVPELLPPAQAAREHEQDETPSPSDVAPSPAEPFASASPPESDLEEPPPPPLVAAASPVPEAAGIEPAELVDPESPSEWRRVQPPSVPSKLADAVHFPAVGFARGGRPRPWDRVRANPYVYMAVGACGLALFASALLGFLLGRPTGPGLALGVVGVICLAPALAFFLHRRGAGRAGD